MNNYSLVSTYYLGQTVYFRTKDSYDRWYASGKIIEIRYRENSVKYGVSVDPAIGKSQVFDEDSLYPSVEAIFNDKIAKVKKEIKTLEWSITELERIRDMTMQEELNEGK